MQKKAFQGYNNWWQWKSHGILVCTNKEINQNILRETGEGGFGCVFKGVLPDCTVVAVKKLKCLRQEDKQFRAEVETIGMIQHANIVRLLGFCAKDSGRFLV